jgi:hypothetical protein
MLSGTWRLNFHLESLTSGDDRDLGALSIPAVPGSVSYTEESKIDVGIVPVGVYKLVTSVSFLGPKGSPVFVNFDEQFIQIESD